MTVAPLQSGANSKDKVKVAVRVRPFSQRERNTKTVARVAAETVYLAHPNDQKPPRPFTFDFCFGDAQQLDNSVDAANGASQSADPQEQVFQAIGTEVVDNAFFGFNTCVFAYGQTGSGKSFTMMGTREAPGLIPRLCTELFCRLEREKEEEEANRFKVEISFYEVYNERIHDLLGPANNSKRQSLKVREHSLLGPMVEGLTVFLVHNYAQIERLIEQGNCARTTAATLMNDQSSRSHSVFTVKMTETIVDAGDRTFTGEKVSKISLVDLAGSERAQKTGATGKRLEEGGNINKSLTALGKVFSALAADSQQQKGDSRRSAGTAFVPYRDSVLTWLLKENLGGNSRTTMIATISPSADNFEETLSTLRFADRAKRIQTHAVVNEDPNAKIIRELHEEVDRLRQLNQSHTEQQQTFQLAMEQIAQRHQQDKKMALEQQYEQFSHYIKELTQSLQTPMTPVAPFAGGSSVGFFSPFGPSVPPTPSAMDCWSSTPSAGFFGVQSASDQQQSKERGRNVPSSSKRKFLEWAHKREELFAHRLRQLRLSIRHAHELATEANALVALLERRRKMDGGQSHNCPGGRQHSRAHFSVTLQIPAENLRPCKIGSDSVAEGEGESGRGGGGGCVCEPVIELSWAGGQQKNGRKGSRGASRTRQRWTAEQMERKLTELRSLISNSSSGGYSLEEGQSHQQNGEGGEEGQNGNSSPVLLALFGNLLARRERHCLIGVANVHLGMLLQEDWPGADSQVLIVSQQGEICGKLHVQVGRVALQQDESPLDDSEDEFNHQKHHFGEENREHSRLLGRTMICRVEVKKATNLPVELAHFVFCQFSFFQHPPQVVAANNDHFNMAENGNNDSFSSTVLFNTANEFEVQCNRAFMDYMEEDALSIEVWGHRGQTDEEEEEESSGEEEEEDELIELDRVGRPKDTLDRQKQENNNVTDVAERKKKSLQERWQEVTRRIELWVDILELNPNGEYEPVQVETSSSSRVRECATGGIYRLRQGQQRRIEVRVNQSQQPEEGEESALLPLRLCAIESISVGSPLVVHEGQAGGELDSYQELDLVRLRGQWSEVLEKRGRHLQREIQTLTSKGTTGKSRLDEEREKSLLLNWVELVEERNAISIPCKGIPGALCEEETGRGLERHCPLVFLAGCSEDGEAEEDDGEGSPQQRARIVGENSLLSFEDPDSQMELAILGRDAADENKVSCFCPWDSSMHACPALNRSSRDEERVFLIVKVKVRIAQTICAEFVLRKRICLLISSANAFPSWNWLPNWPRWNECPAEDQQRRGPGTTGTGTGVPVDIVACIPKATLDLENREMMARLAVRHATQWEADKANLADGPLESPAAEEENSWNGEQNNNQNSNFLSEYVSKTIMAVEWLIKMDRLRQEEAIGRAMARQRRLKQSCRPRSVFESRMKRTISLPTTMNNYLSPSSSFQCRFDPIEDESPAVGSPQHSHLLSSSSSSRPVDQHHHHHHRRLLPPSQSHTDGFPLPPMSSSPASSGYASMVNSLAIPLNGISEEMGLAVNSNGEAKEDALADELEEEEPARQNDIRLDQPVATHDCGQSSAAVQSAPDNDCAPSLAPNGLLPRRPRLSPQSPPPASCCCENRLFSPQQCPFPFNLPPQQHQQRKLFFQNTINSCCLPMLAGDSDNGRNKTKGSGIMSDNGNKDNSVSGDNGHGLQSIAKESWPTANIITASATAKSRAVAAAEGYWRLASGKHVLPN